jgi:hypothetical protein
MNNQTDDTDEGGELRPAVRRIDERDAESGGNVAGSLTPQGPLEPEDIDPENALFVLLGVVFVTTLVVVGISGL